VAYGQGISQLELGQIPAKLSAMKDNMLNDTDSKHGCTLLAVGLLMAQTFSVLAAIVPSDRLPAGGRWSNVGVPGGIPARTNIFVNVLTTGNSSYKCYTNGTDCSTAINNAIAACPSNQVVYLPAGNYTLSTQIRPYNSYVTIRGDGPGKTILTGGSSGCISIGTAPWITEWPMAVSVTNGYTKGSTNVSVSGTGGLSVGGLMWIEQDNDSAVFGYGCGGTGSPTSNSSGRLRDNNRVLGQIVLITAINGNSVTFTPPLNFDFLASHNPQAAGFSSVGPKYFGVEDLTVNGSSGGMGVWWMGSYAGWMKNVDVKGFGTWGVDVQMSLNMEIRHCYIHEPADYNWSRGYAYQFDSANNVLTEDNIVWHCQDGMILQGACSGNVFGYNFIYQGYNVYNGINIMLPSYSGNHTPFPTTTLYEGNFGSSIKMDFYYGPSRWATLLRNYLTGTDPDVTQNRYCIAFDSRQWSNSVVGNILGSIGTNATFFAALPGVSISYTNTTALSWSYNMQDGGGPNFIYRMGYPYIGNNSYAGTGNPPTTNQLDYLDLSVWTNTLVHGNYDWSSKTVKWNATIADTNIPNSYYLSGKPSWFGNLPWPPYDPTNSTAASMTNIPAGYRFVFGVDPPSGGPDTNAPIISSISAGPLTTNSATITWTTSEPATSIVDDGATTAYGTSVTNGSLVVLHSLTIAGLSSGCTNHFRVRSADGSGNLATSSDGTFTTPPAPPTGLRVISP
jgi:hypothetical protein